MKHTVTKNGKFTRVTHKQTGIWCEMVQMSRSAVNGQEVMSFRRHYNRFIHPEIEKHRMWSLSAESSRARPTLSMVKNILKHPAGFPYIGYDCSGMQSKERAGWFVTAVYTVLSYLHMLITVGFALFSWKVLRLHKQVVNRDIERYAMINDVTTGTDLDHFLNLRIDDAADPVVQIIAEQMFLLRDLARKNCEYEVLSEGEWHVPFVTRKRDENNRLRYYDGKGKELTTNEAKELSTVSCAQTSYRRNNDVYDPSHRVWKLLIESKPVHATPVEHQATPMSLEEVAFRFNTFSSFLDVIDCLPPEADIVNYSGNFKGWRQHRKEIEGEKFMKRFETDRVIEAEKPL